MQYHNICIPNLVEQQEHLSLKAKRCKQKIVEITKITNNLARLVPNLSTIRDEEFKAHS